MQRREFLKLSSLLMASGALPIWSRSLMAQDRPLLPIPSLLTPDLHQRINLTAMAGKSNIAGHAVETWGYNGNLLGPAIRLKRNQLVTVNISNQLPESTTLHWHGLVVGGHVDGGPHGVIAPGAHRQVSFRVDQPASTCWYHPHPHGLSGYQVAKGLAGLLIIDDDDIQKLRLPSQWGVDDIPLIFQDKQLDQTGTSIDYQLDVMHAAMGYFGNMMLTNGVQYPQQAVPNGWVRFRLLNGCNARSMHLTTSDRRPLYVIASDGGLLTEPVKVETLSMMPGERFEVLVETSRGKPFDFVTLPVTQMGMTLPPFDKPVPLVQIMPLPLGGASILPDHLSKLAPIGETTQLTRRHIQLSMDPKLDQLGMAQLMKLHGHHAMEGMSMHGNHQAMPEKKTSHTMENMKGMDGMGEMAGMSEHHHHSAHAASGQEMHGSHAEAYDFHTGNKINGQAYQMDKIAWDVPVDKPEVWEISGEGDAMLHPFHIHGTQYRILSENGQPVPAHRQGWKDIVSVEGAKSEVLVRFPYTASKDAPYMAHCHILEHEDTGMMMSFTVSS